MTFSSRTRGHRLAHRLEQMHSIPQRVAAVQQTLNQAQMIDAYNAVALEHGFSAPLVAVMRATPGFPAAVKNFPESSLFNIVPEHQSSVRQSMGLESLVEAQGETVDYLTQSANGVVAAVGEMLEGLEETATDFHSQLAEDKASIEMSALSDDAIAVMVVNSMSAEGFDKLFVALEHHLGQIEVFDVDHLRANPEQIQQEIEGLTALVAEHGLTLGLDISEYGLTEGARDDVFTASAGTFAEKGLDKATIVFYLDRAAGLCDQLNGIGQRKMDLIAGLESAVAELPEKLNSDEVTYGANEHMTLFGCYATLVSKVVRESIVLTSRLLTTVDGVVEASTEAEA